MLNILTLLLLFAQSFAFYVGLKDLKEAPVGGVEGDERANAGPSGAAAAGEEELRMAAALALSRRTSSNANHAGGTGTISVPRRPPPRRSRLPLVWLYRLTFALLTLAECIVFESSSLKKRSTSIWRYQAMIQSILFLASQLILINLVPYTNKLLAVVSQAEFSFHTLALCLVTMQEDYFTDGSRASASAIAAGFPLGMSDSSSSGFVSASPPRSLEVKMSTYIAMFVLAHRAASKLLLPRSPENSLYAAQMVVLLPYMVVKESKVPLLLSYPPHRSNPFAWRKTLFYLITAMGVPLLAKFSQRVSIKDTLVEPALAKVSRRLNAAWSRGKSWSFYAQSAAMVLLTFAFSAMAFSLLTYCFPNNASLSASSTTSADCETGEPSASHSDFTTFGSTTDAFFSLSAFVHHMYTTADRAYVAVTSADALDVAWQLVVYALLGIAMCAWIMGPRGGLEPSGGGGLFQASVAPPTISSSSSSSLSNAQRRGGNSTSNNVNNNNNNNNNNNGSTRASFLTSSIRANHSGDAVSTANRSLQPEQQPPRQQQILPSGTIGRRHTGSSPSTYPPSVTSAAAVGTAIGDEEGGSEDVSRAESVFMTRARTEDLMTFEAAMSFVHMLLVLFMTSIDISTLAFVNLAVICALVFNEHTVSSLHELLSGVVVAQATSMFMLHRWDLATAERSITDQVALMYCSIRLVAGAIWTVSFSSHVRETALIGAVAVQFASVNSVRYLCFVMSCMAMFEARIRVAAWAAAAAWLSSERDMRDFMDHELKVSFAGTMLALEHCLSEEASLPSDTVDLLKEALTECVRGKELCFEAARQRLVYDESYQLQIQGKSLEDFLENGWISIPRALVNVHSESIIFTDWNLLHHIVDNAVSNAIKYGVSGTTKITCEITDRVFNEDDASTEGEGDAEAEEGEEEEEEENDGVERRTEARGSSSTSPSRKKRESSATERIPTEEKKTSSVSQQATSLPSPADDGHKQNEKPPGGPNFNNNNNNNNNNNTILTTGTPLSPTPKTSAASLHVRIENVPVLNERYENLLRFQDTSVLFDDGAKQPSVEFLGSARNSTLLGLPVAQLFAHRLGGHAKLIADRQKAVFECIVPVHCFTPASVTPAEGGARGSFSLGRSEDDEEREALMEGAETQREGGEMGDLNVIQEAEEEEHKIEEEGEPSHDDRGFAKRAPSGSVSAMESPQEDNNTNSNVATTTSAARGGEKSPSVATSSSAETTTNAAAAAQGSTTTTTTATTTTTSGNVGNSTSNENSVGSTASNSNGSGSAGTVSSTSTVPMGLKFAVLDDSSMIRSMLSLLFKRDFDASDESIFMGVDYAEAAAFPSRVMEINADVVVLDENLDYELPPGAEDAIFREDELGLFEGGGSSSSTSSSASSSMMMMMMGRNREEEEKFTSPLLPARRIHVSSTAALPLTSSGLTSGVIASGAAVAHSITITGTDVARTLRRRGFSGVIVMYSANDSLSSSFDRNLFDGFCSKSSNRTNTKRALAKIYEAARRRRKLDGNSNNTAGGAGSTTTSSAGSSSNAVSPGLRTRTLGASTGSVAGRSGGSISSAAAGVPSSPYAPTPRKIPEVAPTTSPPTSSPTKSSTSPETSSSSSSAQARQVSSLQQMRPLRVAVLVAHPLKRRTLIRTLASLPAGSFFSSVEISEDESDPKAALAIVEADNVVGVAAARSCANPDRVIVGIYGGMKGRTVWSPFLCSAAFPSLPPPSTRKSPLPTSDFSASLFYFATGIDVLVDWNDPAVALASPHATEELDFIADFTDNNNVAGEKKKLWSRISKFRIPPTTPIVQGLFYYARDDWQPLTRNSKGLDESVLAGFPDKEALINIMYESLVEALRKMKRDSSISGVRKVAHSVKGASAQIGLTSMREAASSLEKVCMEAEAKGRDHLDTEAFGARLGNFLFLVYDFVIGKNMEAGAI